MNDLAWRRLDARRSTLMQRLELMMLSHPEDDEGLRVALEAVADEMDFILDLCQHLLVASIQDQFERSVTIDA